MQSKTILDIYKGLMPDNLKENPNIDSLFNIFLNEAEASLDLSNNPLNAYDFNFLDKNGFLDTKKQLLSIYMQEITKTFENASSDQEIYNKFRDIYTRLGLDTSSLTINTEIEKHLNEEYFNSAKDYKLKKGTATAFYFIYDIINKVNLQTLDNDTFFRLFEGTEDNPNQPFVYRIETSLYKEVFEKTVLPLSHPVGFDYIFYRLVAINFTDYFGLEISSKITKLDMNCFDTVTSTTRTKDLLENALITNFKEYINQQNEYKIVFDRTFENETHRFYKDFGDVIKEYSIDNLTIKDVKMVDSSIGEIINKVYLDDENTKLGYFEYRQYSLNDNSTFNIEFTLTDDSSQLVNISSISLNLTEIGLNPENKLYWNTVLINAETIFKGATDLRGNYIKDYDTNCNFNYINEIQEKIITSDELTSTDYQYNEDFWDRNKQFDDVAVYIGSYIYDPGTVPLYQYPIIGATDANGEVYKIGLTSTNRTQYLSTDFDSYALPNGQDISSINGDGTINPTTILWEASFNEDSKEINKNISRTDGLNPYYNRYYPRIGTDVIIEGVNYGIVNIGDNNFPDEETKYNMYNSITYNPNIYYEIGWFSYSTLVLGDGFSSSKIEEDVSYGVYRNEELLEDNNVSAL